MKIKTIIILLNILAFLTSVIWLYMDQTLEPLISTLSLTGTLLVLFFNNDNDSKTKMRQKGGKNSTNYQAGGNINL
ncbi:hypothetical protein D0809_05770 [Flavobacterium circumlabens]|uniref:Uncharacterized protein n=1 Tax=Flavobacterium circumlabens TaxID=2133765 RepID=A0A4Y7UFN2_9FLAO|nr:hypothetical protein [Flavobacterium circumlabens]TCN59400.1 hypothetical protein EV142_10215 [Flavobacterium circumlabens]TEB44708.1 hypothetical protein D0809_05770 [Flavobacterium circumlabens]